MVDGKPPAAPLVREPAVKAPPVAGRPRRPRQSAVVGGLLILLGAILLLGQFAPIWHFGWPLFIIAPGVLVLLTALTSRGAVGEGLAITGSLITVTGLILLVQNATNHWASWAYAWALVFPGSVGAGMMFYGMASGRSGNLRFGSRLLAAGLVTFFLGALFFEGVLQISGYQFDRGTGVAVGALIIGAGALILILNLMSPRRSSS